MPDSTHVDREGCGSEDRAWPSRYFYNIALPVNVSMDIQVTVSNGLQIYATSTIRNQFFVPANHALRFNRRVANYAVSYSQRKHFRIGADANARASSTAC